MATGMALIDHYKSEICQYISQNIFTPLDILGKLLTHYIETQPYKPFAHTLLNTLDTEIDPAALLIQLDQYCKDHPKTKLINFHCLLLAFFYYYDNWFQLSLSANFLDSLIHVKKNLLCYKKIYAEKKEQERVNDLWEALEKNIYNASKWIRETSFPTQYQEFILEKLIDQLRKETYHNYTTFDILMTHTISTYLQPKLAARLQAILALGGDYIIYRYHSNKVIGLFQQVYPQAEAEFFDQIRQNLISGKLFWITAIDLIQYRNLLPKASNNGVFDLILQFMNQSDGYSLHECILDFNALSTQSQFKLMNTLMAMSNVPYAVGFCAQGKACLALAKYPWSESYLLVIIPHLLAKMNEPNSLVMWDACQALSELNIPTSLQKEVLRAIADKVKVGHRNAYLALAKLKIAQEDISQLLIDILPYAYSAISGWADETLHKICKTEAHSIQVIDFILEKVAHNGNNKLNSIKLLQNLSIPDDRYDRVVSFIKRSLHNPNTSLMKEIRILLSQMVFHDETIQPIVDRLLPLIMHPNQMIKIEAIMAVKALAPRITNPYIITQALLQSLSQTELFNIYDTLLAFPLVPEQLPILLQAFYHWTNDNEYSLLGLTQIIGRYCPKIFLETFMTVNKPKEIFVYHITQVLQEVMLAPDAAMNVVDTLIGWLRSNAENQNKYILEVLEKSTIDNERAWVLCQKLILIYDTYDDDLRQRISRLFNQLVKPFNIEQKIALYIQLENAHLKTATLNFLPMLINFKQQYLTLETIENDLDQHFQPQLPAEIWYQVNNMIHKMF